MSGHSWTLLGIAIVLAAVAAVLAAGETALHSLSKSRAQQMLEEGAPGARRVVDLVVDPAPTINTSTLVRTVCESLTAVFVALIVLEGLGVTGLAVVIIVVAMTLVNFLVWNFVPRTLGRQHAYRVASRLAVVLGMLTTALGWLSTALIVVGNAITPGRGYAEGPFSSEAELREMVDIAEASEVIEHGEREMLHSVFELADTLVREVMVPRTDVVYIKRDRTLRQGMSLALRSGFSRIPVVGENLDEILGILYFKDLTKRSFDNPDAQQRELVESLMRPATFCPDSKPIDELLREMQTSHNHMVVVVDEFGGTAGLATLEDIVEEIVGEITDEFDAEPDMVEETSPGTYRISARMSLDDLGELFGVDLTDDEVDTAGGLMAKVLNTVPIQGSRITWQGLELTAERMSGRRHRLDTLLVRRHPEVPAAAGDRDTVGGDD